MPLRLICGPTGSGKTHQAINDFLEALDDDRTPVFIAPSQPDARHFEREILRQAPHGVQTGGKVTTFGSLSQRVLHISEPQARVLTFTERFLLMRMVIDRNQALAALAESAGFDGFVISVLKVIAELEALGVDAGGMEVFRAWAKGDAWREALGKDLFRLYDDYLAALRAQGAYVMNSGNPDLDAAAALRAQEAYDDELAQRRAITAIADDPDLLGARTMVVDGFRDFTPLQHDLMRAISETGVELIVTLPYEPGNDRFESLGIHFELLGEGADVELLTSRGNDERVPALRHLGENLFLAEPAAQVPANGAVTVLRGAGRRGQAELVAAEILKLARSGQALDDIAVVCRSLGPDMDAIAAAMREFGVPFELSSPVPLKNTPVGRAATAALDFIIAGGRARLVAFLKNVPALAPEEIIDEFNRRARIKGKEDAHDLLRLWRHINQGRPLAEMERLMAAASKGVEPLGEELCSVIGAAVGAGVAGTAAIDEAGLDLLSLQCLKLVCSEATRAEAAVGKVITGAAGNHTSATSLLRRGIAAAQLRAPITVSRGCVRLLDPHRVLNQRFDIVFICGLLEKQFPNLGREDSFFSESDRYELKSLHGLTLETREFRLAEERFLFHRALSRARHKVYLCYPYCDQEGKPTIPSLFVDDALEPLLPGTYTKIERGISEVTFAMEEAPTRQQALRALALYAGSHDLAAPAWRQVDEIARVAGLKQRLHASLARPSQTCLPLTEPLISGRLQIKDEFRVTELQGYLGCPFRYFVQYLLQPQEMEPVSHTLKRGQIAHDILCDFGERVLMQAKLVLSQADNEQLREAQRQMFAAIADAFANTGEDLETIILRTELEHQLIHFMERESTSGRRLQTYDLEMAFGNPRDGCGGGQSTENMLKINDIRVKGRIDRVDWESRNRAVAIDFKTSKTVYSWRDFEQRGEIQIPLYILALRDVFGFEPVGGEYYALRGEKRGGLYLAGSEEMLGADSGQMNARDFVEPEIFEAQLQAARELAYAAATSIRRGEFSCQPRDERTDCGWCSYGGICRHTERQAIEVVTGAE